MKEWCRENDDREMPISEVLRSWTCAYERVVSRGLGWVKRRKGGTRPPLAKEIVKIQQELRVLMKE